MFSSYLSPPHSSYSFPPLTLLQPDRKAPLSAESQARARPLVCRLYPAGPAPLRDPLKPRTCKTLQSVHEKGIEVAASNQKPVRAVTEVVYILDAPMPRPQARSEGTRCCNQCTVEADAYTIRCKRRPYAGLGPLTFTYVMELDDGGTRQHKDAVSPLPSLPPSLSLPMRRIALSLCVASRCELGP
jgi:hypothetical protein